MFVIVRHGNTFESGDQPRRIGARTDLPLTGQGIGQAKALGKHFTGLGWQFSRVLASPLARTRQTAAAILTMQQSALDVEPAEFLREIDHGPDENMTEGKVIDRIGADAIAAWENSAIPPDGWIANPDERIDAWRGLFANEQYGAPTLLVTSNGAARFALLATPSLRDAIAELPSLKLPTGGYGVIARNDLGQLQVVDWGVRP